MVAVVAAGSVPVVFTVNVYEPDAVPGSLDPPPPPPLDPPPPPHALNAPNASIITNMPSIARHALRRAGIPNNTVSARIAPDPASAAPLPGNAGRLNAAVVAAFVATVAVPLPLCPKAVADKLQVGVSAVEFDGPPEFKVHDVRLTFDEYPFVVVHVIVEVAGLPRLIAAGAVAASVYVDCVIVTDVVPFAAAYTESPAYAAVIVSVPTASTPGDRLNVVVPPDKLCPAEVNVPLVSTIDPVGVAPEPVTVMVTVVPWPELKVLGEAETATVGVSSVACVTVSLPVPLAVAYVVSPL